MVKKAIYPGTRGRKNKVLKRPIYLTGINKVPIVGWCPVGKSPTSLLTCYFSVKKSEYMRFLILLYIVQLHANQCILYRHLFLWNYWLIDMNLMSLKRKCICAAGLRIRRTGFGELHMKFHRYTLCASYYFEIFNILNGCSSNYYIQKILYTCFLSNRACLNICANASVIGHCWVTYYIGQTNCCLTAFFW